ncbi:MAG TPA: MBL fold metallo-hydrolase [Longilinea sp.]|nr:MBL fold metallo-hydrolase [Longilinea sp.]
MTLEIATYVLGPLSNNTYLLGDSLSRQAVLIDPSFDSENLLEIIRAENWKLTAIWVTHAHFDHMVGVEAVSQSTTPPLPVGLHPADRLLWRSGALADQFGLREFHPPEPTILFSEGQELTIGDESVRVDHTPGHSPGSVIFYSASAGTCLTGDLIFRGSIGRTDLVGGNLSVLMASVQEKILTLPPETRLLPGHGEETTVAEEMRNNPFL